MPEPTQENVSTSVLKVMGQINPLIGMAAGILASVRKIRDAVKDANPTAPEGTIPSDAQIIGNLMVQCGFYKADSAELREWLNKLTLL